MQRFFMITLLLCLPSWSLAHSVYIFAWVDGSQICTESYFTQKNKVIGGEALMQNSTGEILFQKTTGLDGTACFPLPSKAQKLDFIILAGAGHRGQFTLEESELATAIVDNDANNSQPSGTTQMAIEPAASAQTPQTVNAMSTQSIGSPSMSVSEDQLRTIIQKELQKQLSPLRQYMAEKFENKTPGPREIVGGIGWLMGLGALGYWYSQRRKKGQ